MKFFKKRSLLLILLINISFAQEDAAEYKIELIIFKYMDFETNETFNTKLKVPNKDLVSEWAKANIVEGDLSKIIQDSSFNKKMKEVVDKVNKSLSSIEQIRKFILIDHEFTIENNMMTPSMKVRRFKVKEMYGENLEKLY